MILLPLSVLYGAVMWLRNKAFDWGFIKSHRVNAFVLSVGNLSVGGTGKTPMIETLVSILGKQYTLGMVSRGYRRETDGIHLASGEESAATLGDEPFQLYRKFEHLAVAVGADRTKTVNHLLKQKGQKDIILLDDAFQHRAIKRDLNMMLTTYNRPFFRDYVLPAGNLREFRQGAERADAVIVTKCPEMLPQEASEKWIKRIKNYAPNVEVFFSHVVYEELKAVVEKPLQRDIMVLAGIAQPDDMIQALKKNFNCIRVFEFPDHHYYTSTDLDEILTAMQGKSCSLVTTEKDMVRLLPLREHSLIQKFGLFYLPMKTNIQNNKTFISWLEGRLENHLQKNHKR